MPADLNILSRVSGQESLDTLAKQLAKITSLQYNQNQVSEIARRQNQIQIATLDRQNALIQGHISLTNEEISNLAYQTNLNNELTYAMNNRLDVATNAHALMSAYSTEGIAITEQEAVIANQVNAEIIAGENAKMIAYNNTRKALMSVSISMFVLNISVSQLVSSLKPLVEGNEQAESALKNVQAALSLSLAPMQAFMSIQMVMTATTMSLTQALVLFGGAMLFSVGLMGAMTSKSLGMRVAFSALAAVGAVMAATQFLASIATMTLSGSLATLQAVMGSPAGLAALAIGVGATSFAVGTVLSNKEKAQTLTGHRKKVRKGGLAILDDDEVVSRQHKGSAKGGGGDIIINLPESYNGSMSDAKITAHSVRRLVNSGYGNVKYQRKVVTG